VQIKQAPEGPWRAPRGRIVSSADRLYTKPLAVCAGHDVGGDYRQRGSMFTVL